MLFKPTYRQAGFQFEVQRYGFNMKNGQWETVKITIYDYDNVCSLTDIGIGIDIYYYYRNNLVADFDS